MKRDLSILIHFVVSNKMNFLKFLIENIHYVELLIQIQLVKIFVETIQQQLLFHFVFKDYLIKKILTEDNKNHLEEFLRVELHIHLVAKIFNKERKCIV